MDFLSCVRPIFLAILASLFSFQLKISTIWQKNYNLAFVSLIETGKVKKIYRENLNIFRTDKKKEEKSLFFLVAILAPIYLFIFYL